MIGTTMRRLLGAALLTALVTACGTTVVSGTGRPAPDPTSEAPAAAATGYLLETPEFSLGFPEEPVSGTAPVPLFAELTTATWTVELDDHAHVLGVTDYPTEVPLGDPITVLELARDSVVASFPGAAVTDSTTTEVDGRPALDFSADLSATAAGVAYRSLIVLDGQRLYELATVGAGDRTAEHEAFASSLQLT